MADVPGSYAGSYGLQQAAAAANYGAKMAGQPETATQNVMSRLDATLDQIRKLGGIANEIADAHFGPQPAEGSKDGPTPVPNGTFANMTAKLDSIGHALDRLHSQISRLERI